MTMRDQIMTGITNALSASGPDSTLTLVTSNDYAILADSIMAELANVPADTPAPTVSVAPAGPTLVLSPADVIAASAMDALEDAARERIQMSQYVEDAATTQNLVAGDDYREVREFIFRTQAMFGVRVRSPRPLPDRAASFLIGGSETQIRAFQRTLMMIHNLARPTLADLGPEAQREFWATLGDLCADVNSADHLIEANRAAYDAATEALNEQYGPARTLRRTEAVDHGEVFDLAQSVLAASQQNS